MSLKNIIKDLASKNYRLKKILYTLKYGFPENRKKIKGSNNIIKMNNVFSKKLHIDIIGDSNEVVIKKNAKVSNSTIVIRGTGHKLIIGENCILQSTEFWFEDEYCKIDIGNKTTIEGAHIAVTEPYSSIILGEDCMLSAGIDIRSGDSHSIIDLETDKRINYAKNVKIGNHVWIGNSVKILKGTNIGTDSIIGTGSIVTKNISPKSIATGIPAKVIKNNVTWDRNRIYNQ